MSSHAAFRNPRTVAVIGAGIVGLSCAWFLARSGVHVVVLDRHAVAAGASAGNAGWVSPGLATPWVSRESLRKGSRGLWDRRSSVVVPARAAVWSLPFLAGFGWHSRARRVAEATAALDGLNQGALDAFDLLMAGGVPVRFGEAPILAGFPDDAAAATMVEGLAARIEAGMVSVEGLSATEMRDLEPALGRSLGAGVRIRGQRWLDPLSTTTALATALAEGGSEIRTGVEVETLVPETGQVHIHAGEASMLVDAVIVAAGVWTERLRHELGVRIPMRAGRGYSVRVRPCEPLLHPLYLPSVRLACSPDGEELRVTGIMELGSADTGPLRPRRIDTILRAVERFVVLDGTPPREPWVGARPLTADGLPLVGRSAMPGVYLATGHGMFGLTHGPVTGRLLADYVCGSDEPAALVPLRPTRRLFRAAASLGS